MSERRAICPVCWHEETMRARLTRVEPSHDDPRMMHWQRPYGGPSGQMVTRWDGGWWECVHGCGVRLLPFEAGTLLDAVLRASDPDCDSIVDGVHRDARVALKGGRR